MVHIISKMMRRSSLVIAYHFTRLVSSGIEIPNLYKQDRTYWKNWLKIGIEDVFPDNESKKSFLDVKEHIETINKSEFPMFFDQVLSYAAGTLETVISNNAWVPLFSRLARLTKVQLQNFNISNINTYQVMSAIRSTERDMTGWPSVLQKYVNDIRTRLDVKKEVYLHDSYGEDKPFGIIFKFNYWMQQQFEAFNKRRLKLMPIFGVQRAHVRLDKRTLLCLFSKHHPEDKGLNDFKSLKVQNPDILFKAELEKAEESKPSHLLKKNCNEDQWKDYQGKLKQYNDLVLNIKGKSEYKDQQKKHEEYLTLKRKVLGSFFKNKIIQRKKNWVFDGSISTDGVSISIQYSQKKLVRKASSKPKNVLELSKDEYDRDLPTQVDSTIVLGLDPGRNNLACVTFYLDTGKTHTWKLSRGRYYSESGIKQMNIRKNKRYKDLMASWSTLGGEGVGLATSKLSDILAYLIEYSKISEAWWTLALDKKESRENLQRYAGKRHVLDSFFNNIKKFMKKHYPDKNVCIAYGSAFQNMNAQGRGEIAAPIGPTYASCKRAFKDVRRTNESRSTAVHWKTGTRNELVYKSFKQDNKEVFHHTTCLKAPVVNRPGDIERVNTYNKRKMIQGKHRRGGTSKESWWVAKGIGDPAKEKKKTIRWPEVRGLRFNKKDSMYHDRDREAALTIARICCMEMKGLPRPYPFDMRYKLV
jgi:hypothetical protein